MWSGAAASGSDFMIGDESSCVRLISEQPAPLVRERNGSPTRAGIVPVSDQKMEMEPILPITRNDGTTLIRRNGSSLVEREKQVRICNPESPSTPTIKQF